MGEIHAAGSIVELSGRLLFAVLLGAAVGFDREIRQRPAGLRTHAMVGLGAALAAVLALALESDDPMVQAQMVSRVLQGIIVGIGFVGGGTILRHQSERDVQGLTTATSIWVVAGAGAAAGLGLWAAAGIAAAISLLVLAAGAYVDRVIERRLADSDAGSGPEA